MYSDLFSENKINENLSPSNKLLYILDSGVQKHIITWMEHGNSFLVMNTVALVRQVLNVYCKEAKLTSFDSFEQEVCHVLKVSQLKLSSTRVAHLENFF
jgi:hypothetical protein